MHMPTRYSIEDLLYLMARLRDPFTGCPWDCRQDYGSLTPYTLEEACEVVDAIERNDLEHLPEELGDLLFQVVFFGQMGSECGDFDFGEIVHRLVTKLVSRHPHVFPEGTLASRRAPGSAPEEQEISAIWESKKQNERNAKGRRGLLADVPVSLPALIRAQKIQKRAAKIGFDWNSIDGVVDKVKEELGEFEAEIKAGDIEALDEELGDLLFSMVNLARFAGCDAEKSLRAATEKFGRRFEAMEALASSEGNSLQSLDMDKLEALWQRVKSRQN